MKPNKNIIKVKETVLCFITDVQCASLAGPLAEKLEGTDEECGGQ